MSGYTEADVRAGAASQSFQRLDALLAPLTEKQLRRVLQALAEGLDVFRLPVSAALAGKRIAQAAVRRQTACTVIGLRTNGDTQINPDPHLPLPAQAELLLIGTQEAALRFHKTYGGL
jgi:K+/H+ antiporter YhaU regulatory subunit KhtT